MAEPFKNNINPDLIRQVASVLKNNYGAFDEKAFIQDTTEGLEPLELKARCLHIVEALEQHLPDDFEKAAYVLEASLIPESPDRPFDSDQDLQDGLKGWIIMALQEYVGRNGTGHFDVSLHLLKAMTIRLTSEFGIRYFLEADQSRTLKQMQIWTKDPNEHVRRLVSEGTRPRLPWGRQLKRFIEDPSPIIPLLECLKDDPSEYVRRSVANNLNDIAKDHPSVVLMIAKSWIRDATPERTKLIRHALRTLFKAGDPDALELFGYNNPKLCVSGFTAQPKSVTLGRHCMLDLEILSTGGKQQSLMIDYKVHLQKAKGTSAKVFKWTTVEIHPGQRLSLSKKHPFVPVTTRKYYPGIHQFEVLINGHSIANDKVELSIP
jgi:3-methyladenine DNA glycosylase AlkC